MAEYVTQSEVENTLTTPGILYAADWQRQGELTTEGEAIVAAQIKRAGTIIDFHICDQVSPENARTANNSYLKELAIQLTIYFLTTVGGRDTSESIIRGYDEALKSLGKIKDGARIPAFPYPVPIETPRITRTPRVFNLRGF